MSSTLQFPARFGKYILLDRLNAGGMAEVFRAKVTGVEGFERLVAIKCMLPQLVFDEQFIKMFIDEARLAAQLSHANIVQIYELGRQAERLYIAMELVNGRDVRHILRTAKASETVLPASFAAYVISKAAEGLDFAHRKANVDGTPLNLVHRDVSPQNILVTYDGEVKVVDFGIAKASAEARSTETQAGVLKGKFAYMAPEQVAGEPIDRRADIFALGSVLFEVITGQRLFQGENDLAVLEKVRNAQLPDFKTVLPPDAQGLADILRRALARKPKDRYAYASELAEALEQYLIEDRSIFGTKRASQVMRSLYADEVAELSHKLKAFAEVTISNCVAIIGDREAPSQPRTVYESAFDGKTGEMQVPPHFTAPPSTAVRRGTVAPPQARVIRLSKQNNPQDAMYNGPQTGVGTRPRIMQSSIGQPASTSAVGNHAQPYDLPMAEASQKRFGDGKSPSAARVVMQLRRVVTLAALVMGALVVVASTRVPMTRVLKDASRLLQTAGVPAEYLVAFEDAEPVKPTTEVESNLPKVQDGALANKNAVKSMATDNNGIGFLQLHVPQNVSVRVYVDTVDMGENPNKPLRLPLGRHQVRVVEENQGRAGHHSRQFEVTISEVDSESSPQQKHIVF